MFSLVSGQCKMRLWCKKVFIFFWNGLVFNVIVWFWEGDFWRNAHFIIPSLSLLSNTCCCVEFFGQMELMKSSWQVHKWQERNKGKGMVIGWRQWFNDTCIIIQSFHDVDKTRSGQDSFSHFFIPVDCAPCCESKPSPSSVSSK